MHLSEPLRRRRGSEPVGGVSKPCVGSGGAVGDPGGGWGGPDCGLSIVSKVDLQLHWMV